MHLDFALPVDGDLLAGIERHDQQAAKSVMDYSYHVPLTEYNEKVRTLLSDSKKDAVQCMHLCHATCRV